jgi:hypothetical protein
MRISPLPASYHDTAALEKAPVDPKPTLLTKQVFVYRYEHEKPLITGVDLPRLKTAPPKENEDTA